jgi:retron-type reverse transcriptase
MVAKCNFLLNASIHLILRFTDALSKNLHSASFSKELKIEDGFPSSIFLFLQAELMQMHLYKLLAEDLAVSRTAINRYIESAPKKYKVYTIPKRTSGQRVIAHPAKLLKQYQSSLSSLLESHFSIHECAFAYRKNRSIKDNAFQHVKSEYLLKMDFSDFFHSITPHLFFSFAKKVGVTFSEKEVYLLTKVFFWNPSKISNGKLILSIGAPSSPFISNVVMYLFDSAMYVECKKRSVTYTRYADDITFSTKQKDNLYDIPRIVKKTLLEQFNGSISVNDSKTVFSSKKHNRHVTGVTLTNNNKLSIGRKKKRFISSLIHKFSISTLPKDDFEYLQGLFSHACNIEPKFKQRMYKKYSTEVVNKIIKGVDTSS